MRETKGLQSLRQNSKSFQKERTIQLQKIKFRLLVFSTAKLEAVKMFLTCFKKRTLNLKFYVQ